MQELPLSMTSIISLSKILNTRLLEDVFYEENRKWEHFQIKLYGMHGIELVGVANALETTRGILEEGVIRSSAGQIEGRKEQEVHGKTTI